MRRRRRPRGPRSLARQPWRRAGASARPGSMFWSRFKVTGAGREDQGESWGRTVGSPEPGSVSAAARQLGCPAAELAPLAGFLVAAATRLPRPWPVRHASGAWPRSRRLSALSPRGPLSLRQWCAAVVKSAEAAGCHDGALLQAGSEDTLFMALVARCATSHCQPAGLESAAQSRVFQH